MTIMPKFAAQEICSSWPQMEKIPKDSFIRSPTHSKPNTVYHARNTSYYYYYYFKCLMLTINYNAYRARMTCTEQPFDVQLAECVNVDFVRFINFVAESLNFSPSDQILHNFRRLVFWQFISNVFRGRFAAEFFKGQFIFVQH